MSHNKTFWQKKKKKSERETEREVWLQDWPWCHTSYCAWKLRDGDLLLSFLSGTVTSHTPEGDCSTPKVLNYRLWKWVAHPPARLQWTRSESQKQTYHSVSLGFGGCLLLYHSPVYSDIYKLPQFFYFIDRDMKATFIASSLWSVNLDSSPAPTLELRLFSMLFKTLVILQQPTNHFSLISTRFILCLSHM